MSETNYADIVGEAVRERGPLEAYHHLIGENNRRMAGPVVGNGRALIRERTAIHTELTRRWAAAVHAESGYAKPFAVVALGGTGRAELTPASDLDIALLFDDELEGNRFLLDLQRQTLHTGLLKKTLGFSFIPLPFSLDEVDLLEGKQLNSFLDMSPVYDPSGLAAAFREHIRHTFDPFEHFLHVREFWKSHWMAAAGDTENMGRFDIKNDGLRLFLGGIWTLGGQEFRHSHEIYEMLDDPRDLEAYEFLLRIRGWAHLRRGVASGGVLGTHAEDMLGFDDFVSFGDMLGPDAGDDERLDFANGIRARLLSARRRVAAFARGVIERELRVGRKVESDGHIVLRTSGLLYSTANAPVPDDPVARSRTALSILLAAQRYGVPVDSSELLGSMRNLGDWLVPVPELSALFYETRGSLADSMAFLTHLDGAVERLFPGYSRFEAMLDERVMHERAALRGTWMREKLRTLEACLAHGAERLKTDRTAWNPVDADLREMVANELALLDGDHLAAVRLALVTKRLPLVPPDGTAPHGPDARPHKRGDSGFSNISLDDYYTPLVENGRFSPETARVTRFLVAHRRVFKSSAETGINDEQAVESLLALSRDEMDLRALFVFSCIDSLVAIEPGASEVLDDAHREWLDRESDPARWFNIRELYIKTAAAMRPGVLPDAAQTLRSAGYLAEERDILLDFGASFFGGLYGRYARRFGSHLLRLAEDPAAAPKAALLRDGRAVLLGVAAHDFRGLAACISGALWQAGINLRQAHLFSAASRGLALDFFHHVPGDEGFSPDLPGTIEAAIRNQTHISEADEDLLPPLLNRPALDVMRSGNFRLRYETEHDTAGLVYALSYKVFRHLEGSIHGLNANTVRGRTFITVVFSPPPGTQLEAAREIIASRF